MHCAVSSQSTNQNRASFQSHPTLDPMIVRASAAACSLRAPPAASRRSRQQNPSGSGDPLLGYCPFRGRIPTHRQPRRPHPWSHEPDSWAQARCCGCAGRLRAGPPPPSLGVLDVAFGPAGVRPLASLTHEHIHVHTYMHSPLDRPTPLASQAVGRPNRSNGVDLLTQRAQQRTEPRWMVATGGI